MSVPLVQLSEAETRSVFLSFAEHVNQAASSALPDRFAGLSFETERLLADQAGTRFFRPGNHTLLALFRRLGIRSLRIGGNTADRPSVPVPGPEDIDSLFDFARAGNLKVIYTLRLREGSAEIAQSVASHIMRNHANLLECFAIGNEPEFYAGTFENYAKGLEEFVSSVRSAAPQATFCGPGTTPGREAWARSIVENPRTRQCIRLVTHHLYHGANGRHVTDPALARSRMLSKEWEEISEQAYRDFAVTALEAGLPYRIEETNNFHHGGAPQVSDTFAATLWGLDYLHWWACHGADGINFHTGDNVAAGEEMSKCWYASFVSSAAGYSVRPLGYALAAFAQLGSGRCCKVDASFLPDDFTAYALEGPNRELTWTLINKSHESTARAITMELPANDFEGKLAALTLESPDSDVSAHDGITLGAAEIDDVADWLGRWTPVEGNGTFAVTVPPASAVLLRGRMRAA